MSSKMEKIRARRRKAFYSRHLPPEQVAIILSHRNKEKRHKLFLLFTQKVCQHCGTDKNLTTDHIVPVRITGQHRSKNLANKQLLCRTCNLRKN